MASPRDRALRDVAEKAEQWRSAQRDLVAALYVAHSLRHSLSQLTDAAVLTFTELSELLKGNEGLAKGHE